MENRTVALPDDVRDHIVTSITSSVPTAAIYVFGSRARGDNRPDSDVDLYVISADARQRPLRYASDARASLLWLTPDTFCGKDVLCNTQDEFDRLATRPTVEREVAREGVKIYG